MHWIEDRLPKSKGVYAIHVKKLIEDPTLFFVAYYDGIAWIMPYQWGGEYFSYRCALKWAVIDWGTDGKDKGDNL